MPNLILGNSCNALCPFCFAGAYRTESAKADWISVEEYTRLLPFFGDVVRFCGGEPTLHPKFLDLISIALGSNKNILLMTNGRWPDAVQTYFSQLPAYRHVQFRYLLNVLPPSLYTEVQLARLHRTLSTLCPASVTLGFTIYKSDFDPSYVLALARKYGVKNVRYSVTAPHGRKSSGLLPHVEFRHAAKTLSAFARQARAAGIILRSDCGYLPPCSYDEKDLVDILLTPHDEAHVSFSCPSMVDIGPNGTAWRCYGLYAETKVDIRDFKTSKELEKHFDCYTSLLDNIPLYAECTDCTYKKQDICRGGCYGYRARMLPQETCNPISDDSSLLRCVPEVNEKMIYIWRREGAAPHLHIKEDGPVTPIEIDKNAFTFLESIDGKTPLRRVVEPWMASFPTELEAYAAILPGIRNMFQLGLISLKPDWPKVAAPSRNISEHTAISFKQEV